MGSKIKMKQSNLNIPNDWVAVVDQDDVFIRWASRTEVHRDHLIHRSIHVLVFDEDNRVIIQQRSAQKATYPLYWDVSCSGHVDYSDYPQKNDTKTVHPNQNLATLYEAVAQRELKEELGVMADLHYIDYFKPLSGIHYEQFRLYIAYSTGPFILQDSEVAQIQAVTYDEWDIWSRHEKITNTLNFLIKYSREKGIWSRSPIDTLI